MSDLAKLRASWTPEMFDAFEADLRRYLKDAPIPETEKEQQIAALKQRAIDLVRTSQGNDGK